MSGSFSTDGFLLKQYLLDQVFPDHSTSTSHEHHQSLSHAPSSLSCELPGFSKINDLCLLIFYFLGTWKCELWLIFTVSLGPKTVPGIFFFFFFFSPSQSPLPPSPPPDPSGSREEHFYRKEQEVERATVNKKSMDFHWVCKERSLFSSCWAQFLSQTVRAPPSGHSVLFRFLCSFCLLLFIIIIFTISTTPPFLHTLWILGHPSLSSSPW